MVVAEKKELVQFLLRIYNGPHVANFTAKFRLQCMKCLLFPLCWPLRITYEENHPTYYTNFCPPSYSLAEIRDNLWAWIPKFEDRTFLKIQKELK